MRAIGQMEPWFGIEEQQAVNAYLGSGAWITEFQRTSEFESRIAQYVGAKHCVVTTNGTIALAMALMALGIGKGSAVLVPDYTMIASANAVRLAGAEPVLVDIDPQTACMSLEAAERSITSQTQALMLVSINGRSPNMIRFQDLCKRRGLVLLEDAAQSLGSRWNGRHLGSFGAIGCFSFSVPKIITTGQGGAVVTDDPAIDQRLRLVKDFGREHAGIDKHVAMGYNFKFTDLQSVIGIEQLKKLPWRVQRKKEMFRLYQDLLSPLPQVTFLPTNLQDTSPWFIDILLDPKTRDPLVTFLKQNRIGTRPFYPAIHTQIPYLEASSPFPNAIDISQRGLWLPSSSFLTDDDISYICDHIRKFFQQV